MNKIFFLIVIAFIFSACKTYSEDDKLTFDQKISNYLKKAKVKYTKSDSGLYYFIEKEGEGEFIRPTDEVSFTYIGRLLNGNVFDGKNTKNPVTFKVTELIMGWQEAMLYLKKGGKVKLVVPPQLGYGEYDLDDIPPNSVLLFDIEIKDVL